MDESKAKLDQAFGALPRPPARRLFLLVLPRRQPPRCGGRTTEQAFLQAYRHFERARPIRRAPLRPWLIRIAHNLASNSHRDRPGARGRVSLDESETLAAPTALSESSRAGGAEARHGQPPAPAGRYRRNALIMRFALGMDNREIARSLGRSDGATKVLIHRAIKQLRGGDERQWRPSGRRRREPPSFRPAADRAAGEPLGPPRGDAERGHRGRRRGALGLGRGALGVGAALVARPPQLGSPGSGDRGGGRRRRRPCAGRVAPANGPRASRGSRTRSRRSPIRSETRSGTVATRSLRRPFSPDGMRDRRSLR